MIPWRRDRLPIPLFLGFPGGSAGKESSCNVGDLGLIPGLGRSPREGDGYPLQYSGLENPMDCIVHGVAKSWTQLSNFDFDWAVKCYTLSYVISYVVHKAVRLRLRTYTSNTRIHREHIDTAKQSNSWRNQITATTSTIHFFSIYFYYLEANYFTIL